MVVENQQKPTNHMNYIDAAKAIGIILVVFGHTYGIPIQLYKIVYSFHMPLFFMVAGFLYNKEKYDALRFSQVVFKKARVYLIPYIGYAFVNLVLQVLWKLVFNRQIVDLDYILHNIGGILYCYADMDHMPNCSPLWFLVALFMATVMFWLIMKYTAKYAWISAVVCMGISYGIYWFVDVRLPWNLPSALMGVFFMYIGFMVRKTAFLDKLLQLKGNGILLIVLSGCGCAVALINRENVGMNENTYGYLTSFIVAAVVLSVALMVICKKYPLLQNRLLAWLGRNTMFIMAFNYFMRAFTTEIYYLIPIVRQYPIHWSVSFLLTLIGCVVGSFLYERIKTAVKSNTKEVAT